MYDAFETATTIESLLKKESFQQVTCTTSKTSPNHDPSSSSSSTTSISIPSEFKNPLSSGFLHSLSIPLLGYQGVAPILEKYGIRPVFYEGWKKIDVEEELRGSASGKSREKIVDLDEMLQVVQK